MKRRPEEPLADENLWLLTMSDLLMILLALFVLRLSMGTLPDRRALKGAVPPGIVTGGTPSMRLDSNGRGSSTPAKDGTQFLEHETGGGGRFALPGVVARERGLDTTIELRSVFSASTDELSFLGAENLGKIAKAIAGERVEIGVAVHIAPDTYPAISSAELATLTISRMDAVLRQLIDAGVEPQALYGNFTELRKPSVTSGEDRASEMVELLIRRSFTPKQLGR